MNNMLRYVMLFSLIMPGFYLKAQDIRDSTGLQFRLVNGLDSLDLNTGDILFFQSMTFEGIMTQLGTISPFTHSAMVIKGPDETLWLTHATDNNYEGNGIPVRDELMPRNGVILTRLDDTFLAINNAESGFYKSIWVRKLDDSKVTRPLREDVFRLYEKYKHLPFETSRLRFILSSFDLKLCGKDILSLADNEAVMCSEYIFTLLRELNFPITQKQATNEYTPKDIYRLIDGYYAEPLVYRFKDGLYRLK